MITPSETSHGSLKRQIGLYAATAVTVGSIIGSGIFRSPHSVAQYLTGLPLVLGAWILGGLLSMCGSFVLAELAAARPRTGGLYVFIKEAFGPRLGFVFGWASLSVIKPTVIASIALVFATYFCDATGLPRESQVHVGVAAILLLTGVNWLGVREGAGTQTLLTTLKVIGLLALCAAALGLPHAPPPTSPSESAAASVHPAPGLWMALVLAMIPILFAYDGWTDSTYVAGEILNPRRAMPIAILAGTAAVILIYVLTNLAYYHVLTPGDVAAHEAVASEMIRRILGEGGSRALAVLVAVSTFGTVSASILTGPRVTLAMASDGLFWRRGAHVNARRGSPDFALWLQCVLASGWLVFAGTFEDASGWFVTTSWLFYGLTTAAVFVKRRGERRDPRSAEPGSYRTPLYPLLPVLFILITGALIASDFASTGWRAAAGVLVAAAGFPLYALTAGRAARR